MLLSKSELAQLLNRLKKCLEVEDLSDVLDQVVVDVEVRMESEQICLVTVGSVEVVVYLSIVLLQVLGLEYSVLFSVLHCQLLAVQQGVLGVADVVYEVKVQRLLSDILLFDLVSDLIEAVKGLGLLLLGALNDLDFCNFRANLQRRSKGGSMHERSSWRDGGHRFVLHHFVNHFLKVETRGLVKYLRLGATTQPG